VFGKLHDHGRRYTSSGLFSLVTLDPYRPSVNDVLAASDWLSG